MDTAAIFYFASMAVLPLYFQQEYTNAMQGEKTPMNWLPIDSDATTKHTSDEHRRP
jgi:hypothetical protein